MDDEYRVLLTALMCRNCDPKDIADETGIDPEKVRKILEAHPEFIPQNGEKEGYQLSVDSCKELEALLEAKLAIAMQSPDFPGIYVPGEYYFAIREAQSLIDEAAETPVLADSMGLLEKATAQLERAAMQIEPLKRPVTKTFWDSHNADLQRLHARIKEETSLTRKVEAPQPAYVHDVIEISSPS